MHSQPQKASAPQPPSKAKMALIAGLAFTFLIAVIVWFDEARTQKSVTPEHIFSHSEIAAPPDYANESSWLIRPKAPLPGAWETPWGVDVFFAHPTSFLSSEKWNDDLSLPATTEQHSLTNIYARAFADAGAIYAPRYRQATLGALYDEDSSSASAIELAYADIDRAFQHYLENDNKGRALILVGVDQGGLLIQRLLAEEFVTEDLRQRLVAAYAIETYTPESFVHSQKSWLSVCDTANQFNCFASWNSAEEGNTQQVQILAQRDWAWSSSDEQFVRSQSTPVCFNPVFGDSSSRIAAPTKHLGAAVLPNDPNSQEPEIISSGTVAQCVDNVLVVNRPDDKRVKRNKRKQGFLKAPDYNLFYGNLKKDAAQRARLASAWLDENAAKPAPPLPPIKSISVAPVKKIGDVRDVEGRIP